MGESCSFGFRVLALYFDCNFSYFILWFCGRDFDSDCIGIWSFNSYSFLQVTRIAIKSRMSSIFDQIRPRTAKITALEGLENPHRVLVGQML